MELRDNDQEKRKSCSPTSQFCFVFVFGDERLSFETIQKQHSLYFRFQPKDLVDVPEHHSANKKESPRNILDKA